MENLIRIKLDPKRGGVDPVDFIRPCFIVYDWPGDEVDVWFSDDNGSTWEKLESGNYRAGYDFELKRLYLTLLFDVDTVSQLAMFGSGGSYVGVGFSLTDYDLVPVGWDVEGIHGSVFPVGCQAGNVSGFEVGAGVTVEGEFPRGIPAGFFVKCPDVRNFAVGFAMAAPVDSIVPAGFNIGTVFSESQGIGMTIMGLSEYGLSFMSLDESTVDGLSGEAVHRKQKVVTLNGTDPEELD